jgi:hypothetical protein
LWAAAALLIAFVPIGWVSPDGLGAAQRASGGAWTLNPNHLLFDPINALWLRLSHVVMPGELAVDRLRRLAAVWAALTLAVFRGAVAPRLSASRAAANYGTAWCGGCAVFLLLAVSAETYILQLPFIAVAAAALLRLSAESRPAAAAALGAAIAGATLCFASNLLLLPAAALALAKRRSLATAQRRRLIAITGLAFAAIALPAVLLAWRAVAPNLGLADWMTSYGGRHDPGRLAAAYGLSSQAEIGPAAMRAIYGCAKSVVDLVPAVAGWRDAGQRLAPLVRLMVAALACWSLGGGRGGWREVAPTVWLTLPTVALFGFLWNNSDEQFYAPLAVAIGALAACRGSRSRPALVAGAIALAWNVADVTLRYGLYPRAARLAELGRLVDGADLVLYPGFDELEVLLRLSPEAPPSLSVTATAKLEPSAGLERLRALARATLGRGGRVVCLDLYDRPPGAPPWKFLRGVGYSPEAVRGALAGLGFAPAAQSSSRLWTVRVARAAAADPDSPPP